MSHLSRRSFLTTSAAVAAGTSALGAAQDPKTIPGFDQTKTDYDPTKEWKPFSDRKIRLGIVGHGICKFGLAFDLQNHPNVELVAVSDLFPDRCAEMAQQAKCEKTYPSLEEMVKDDSIEAIYCATDAPSHAKHAILCLQHGKHVATAVPAFRGDIEDAEKLLECCKSNPGLVYAMFETSQFHDDLYAMERLYAAGVFGRLVYSEGEYCHPHSLGSPSLGSYKDWRKKGCPMWYPTHATAYYVGVTHKSFLEVSCQGTADFEESRRVPNSIGNVFTSEVGLFRTAEGGISRMMVCKSQGEYLEAGRIRGEYAGYNHTFTGDETGRKRYEEALKNGLQLKKPALPPGVQAGGHGGSHGYLGDDFIDAILRGRKPAVDVIDALNMTVPGYYAHLSAMKDGETLKIPQYSL
ncbi:Gfo/Idh/MocA family oxidoreductase [Planctomyces sp. SH-PL62]|uniref:Gfo/Idh/MocA family oxidoreductase n=1 Tax=Planctomyces sp. SH-PL62 TaxID=1636152 RepID=UPI00078B2EC8|nr:Gfo/Idh/MocA family oxidoreductase [Planctomyces sp. SH-PL62]AMV40521.1 Glycosyl hydrolase family 109 protein 1 precursor [Planctomyces sp. SH-PL62]